ncbi:MAG TPA: hypothetical protein VMM82_09030 [Spirochaetia bacterium]|nr:hypothetical protein [Spirochaetia bacterium]
MKRSLSSSILRLGFLLVLVGFFAPICCDISGYQLAQGILGNAHQAGNAFALGAIEDVYGYLLLGVFILALLGLVLSFLNRVPYSRLTAAMALAASCVLLIIVALRLKSFRDSGILKLALTIIPINVKPLIGAYAMAVGYLAGATGAVLSARSFFRRR